MSQIAEHDTATNQQTQHDVAVTSNFENNEEETEPLTASETGINCENETPSTSTATKTHQDTASVSGTTASEEPQDLPFACINKLAKRVQDKRGRKSTMNITPGAKHAANYAVKLFLLYLSTR